MLKITERFPPTSDRAELGVVLGRCWPSLTVRDNPRSIVPTLVTVDEVCSPVTQRQVIS